MRIATISLATILVAAYAAVPSGMAEHKDDKWGNYGSCETTLLQLNLGTVLSGKHCALDNIGFIAGTHIDLEVRPLTGYDVRSVNLSFYVNDRSTINEYDPSATPVWSCNEGYVDEVYVECPDRILAAVDIPYGDYTAVMTINVNQTEIAPTIGGVTIPTGLFVSGGKYGFDIWYNLRN